MSDLLEDSLRAWQANAAFWDDAMGETSNAFHRQVVRPHVDALLDAQPTDFVLDIACGNGNYAAYLAGRGVRVVAFDYAPNMIARARARQARFAAQIEFCIADATKADSLMALRREKPFTKAVSNMAVMDIADLDALFPCVNRLLASGGAFVFATQHPCFVTLTDRYRTPHSYLGVAINGQPQKQWYFHRSLQALFNHCFTAGFVIDGFLEAGGAGERPEIIVVRARKARAL